MITVFISTHFFLATSFFSPISVKLSCTNLQDLSTKPHFLASEMQHQNILTMVRHFLFFFFRNLFATFEDRVPLTVHLA